MQERLQERMHSVYIYIYVYIYILYYTIYIYICIHSSRERDIHMVRYDPSEPWSISISINNSISSDINILLAVVVLLSM